MAKDFGLYIKKHHRNFTAWKTQIISDAGSKRTVNLIVLWKGVVGVIIQEYDSLHSHFMCVTQYSGMKWSDRQTFVLILFASLKCTSIIFSVNKTEQYACRVCMIAALKQIIKT